MQKTEDVLRFKKRQEELIVEKTEHDWYKYTGTPDDQENPDSCYGNHLVKAQAIVMELPRCYEDFKKNYGVYKQQVETAFCTDLDVSEVCLLTRGWAKLHDPHYTGMKIQLDPAFSATAEQLRMDAEFVPCKWGEHQSGMM